MKVTVKEIHKATYNVESDSLSEATKKAELGEGTMINSISVDTVFSEELEALKLMVKLTKEGSIETEMAPLLESLYNKLK